MATAQNFFTSLPAPDPRQNPLAAGVAGGLQGLANQGTMDQAQGMDQQAAMQKMMLEMAKQGKFGLTPGAGTTPMSYAGGQGYYDPNGTTPAGALDNAKTEDEEGKTSAAEQHVFATSLLGAIASGYKSSPNQSNYQSAYGLTGDDKQPLKGGDAIEADLLKAQDNVNKRFGYGKYAQQEEAPQGGGDKTAAQNLFAAKDNTPAPSGATQTPRARQLDARTQAAVQAKIDGYMKEGQDPKDVKRVLGQQGIDASKFTYQPGKG